AAEGVQQRGAVQGGLVGVPLHLGEGDGRVGLAAVVEAHGVAGVLPPLVGQAAAVSVDVFDEAVAVGVGVVGEPAERRLQRGQQPGDPVFGHAPAPGVVQEVDPQEGGVDGAVVGGGQFRLAQDEELAPQLVHDLAGG